VTVGTESLHRPASLGGLEPPCFALDEENKKRDPTNRFVVAWQERAA